MNTQIQPTRGADVATEPDAEAATTVGIAATKPPRVRRRPLAVQTIVAVLLLAVVAIGSFVVVDRVIRNQHDRVLEKRSGEVAALVSSALSEVRSALGVLDSLVDPNDQVAFDKASSSLLTGAVRAVGRADREAAGGFVIGAGSGDLVVGAPVAGDRADLLRRAFGADDVVSGVISTNEGPRLVFALAQSSSSRVVFRETAITPPRSLRLFLVNPLVIFS
ncbi:MAG: hypothetical protein JWM12_1055 [Ilumatobacteraceae bacterium]|nr:hypothetical protein [Ilumatobacteraceae bacterium]